MAHPTRSALWSNMLNGVLACCALIVTVLLVRAQVFPKRPAQPNPFLEGKFLDQGYFEGGRRFGPADAPPAMVVFSDYECPACRALHHELEARRLSGMHDLAVVYRHWPLPIHRFAERAAVASECAAAQDRFKSMHDSLFSRQKELGVVPWRELASSAGVADVKRFERCMASDRTVASVRADATVALNIASRGTPTVILRGGAAFVGVPPKKTLDSLIKALSATP